MSSETTYNLTIKGFKTKDDVEQFVAWYSKIGEQDISYWMKEREADGFNISPSNCFYMALYKNLDNQWESNTCTVELRSI